MSTPDTRDTYNQPDGHPTAPSLQEVISQVAPVTPGILILGACEDGLPFLLDLTNPAPGSLLIAGDAGCGKTRLVKAILSSIVLLHKPDQVLFSIVARQPEEYGGLSLANNCQRLLAADDTAVREPHNNLSNLLETRRHGKPYGPMLVLVLDDLASCVEQMGEAELTQLYKLIRHGPRARIWVIATAASDTLALINEQLLTSLRTRFLGAIHSPEVRTYLSNDTSAPIIALNKTSLFSAVVGNEWIRFWICDPEPVPAGQ